VSDLVFDARVLANEAIGSDIRVLRLALPRSLEGFRAGLFLHLQVDPGPLPLFRRAYSLLSARGHEAEVLYKVTGAGTRLLAGRAPGESISVVGPLGNSFTAPADGETAVMVAGGVGLPPVLRWVENLQASGFEQGRLVMLYGARDAQELVLRDRVDALGVRVKYATDDGSFGYHGRVTDLLAGEHDAARAAGASIRYYACGPAAMLSACSEFTRRTGVPGELALETPMPCGTGVCLGCIVPCREGDQVVYKRTCWEGPIFDAQEVVWP
jgi:dihydroorotate dehydrogenase electron transfer subunit